MNFDSLIAQNNLRHQLVEIGDQNSPGKKLKMRMVPTPPSPWITCTSFTIWGRTFGTTITKSLDNTFQRASMLTLSSVWVLNSFIMAVIYVLSHRDMYWYMCVYVVPWWGIFIISFIYQYEIYAPVFMWRICSFIQHVLK